MLAGEQQLTISQLLHSLPQRYTASDRLKSFPTEQSRACLARLHSGNPQQDKEAIETAFASYFGPMESVDATDGLRITFANQEVVHLRPSGNAPEFRCYNEADSPARAEEMNRICMDILDSWRKTS
jgi:phosphomannomutase